MIPERYSHNSEEMQKVMRAMRVRMRNIAMYHFDRIDHRTLRVLQNLDLFEDDAPPIGDNVDHTILRDLDHPKRQNLSFGPLVIYVTEGDNPERRTIELPVHLLSENREMRKAVLESIEGMVGKSRNILTPKTRSLMNEHREALISETPSIWIPAAVIISDALYDDVFIALRGTQQSLEAEPVIKGSLNFYTPKLLHPSISSIDSISLPIGHPEKDHENLEVVFSDLIARASNIAELCGGYFVTLGFLPLSQPYSLANAIVRWLDSNSSVGVWEEVWKWAYTETSPISLYHACSVFVLFPEFIPSGKLPDLWKEMVLIMQGSEWEETENSTLEKWTLRRDLARHYTFHLESRLPDIEGGNIGCIAWWLAEQVAGLFPPDVDSAKFYRENWVKPALNISNQIWLAASPPIQSSFLRYITIVQRSPWAVSLLTLLGGKLEELAPSEQAEEIKEKFNESLIRCALFSLPFPLDSSRDPVFVLECSLADTIHKWADNQTEGHRKPFLDLVSTGQTLGSRDGLCSALQKLGESNLADQIVVCMALKAKVLIDPSIGEDVWKIVSDAHWRVNVIGNAEMRILDLLVESLTMLLVSNNDKWFSNLPHFIAELCEREDNEERKKALFLYVIHTSLASDTVSALRRLVRGEQRAQFVDFVKEYREWVEPMLPDYPPWVAGKLRGLLASLYVH